MLWLRLAVGLIALGCATSCTTRSATPLPSPPVRDEGARPPALDDAIARWHDDDDIEPLAAYVADHPSDELGVWREVVALARYETTHASSDAALLSLAHEFPDTVAGSVAALTVQGEALARVEADVPGMLAVDFLDGKGGWACDADGRAMLPRATRESIERARSAGLRERFGDALVAEGCVETMGYCTWWTTRFPTAPQTAAIERAVAAEWYRRGHPTWKGGEHARCALRCAKRCRQSAEPLVDDCYDGCYSRC
jgi:hypothetical protein